ncbi:MAG: glycosidase, partial [Chloroflexi bacterium]|nr:glycosidase [Chloroflexota bacterium]
MPVSPSNNKKNGNTRKEVILHPFEKIEACYKNIMQTPLKQAEQIREADIVVGIPFYNEADSVPRVVEIAKEGLNKYYPGFKCVIVAAGSPAGREALEAIDALPQDNKIERITFLLDDERINGKGWSVRAIAEIAQTLGADQVILEADLKSRKNNGDIEGLAPDWIYLLLEPIRTGQADMVVSKFNRHFLEAPISTFTMYPLFTAIYNCPIHRLVGGQWGISHHMLRNYLKDARRMWATDISGYGIDIWIAASAIVSGAKICEANLGIKIHKPSIAKNELILRQVASVLFAQIVADKEWWEESHTIRELPLMQPLATFGTKKAHIPDEFQISSEKAVTRFKQGFNKFHLLYQKVFPEEIYQQLDKLVTLKPKSFRFSSELWAKVIYHLLLAYAFGKDFAKGDLLDSLIPLHNGFMGGFNLDMQAIRDKLDILPPDEQDRLVSLEADRRIEELANEFLRQKSEFVTSWEMSAEILRPPVPQVTYREFIPGVPLVVPTELTTPQGKLVRATEIYNTVFSKQKEDFEHFVYERLKIPRDASSLEVSMGIKDYLHSVEDEILPGIDLSTIEGTQSLVNIIFEIFPHGQGFSAIPEMASRFLAHYPPLNLITKLGYANLDELLEGYDPLDILALTNWTEEREYLLNLWQLIADGLRSEHLAPCSIKPIVVRHEDFPSLVEMKDSSALDKFTSRIVISNLHKGMGGEFPKLRYLCTIGKNLVEAERLGQIWQQFAAMRKDFGRKVVDSIEGHWGRDPLSAHNIFEDGNQRILVERVREMVKKIDEDESTGDRTRVARFEHLRDLAESYHLALALPDGKFVTCSVWSWASYSFKGGRASPPPLSLHVERDWSSREFLVEYYKAIGGTEEEVEEKIIELMEQGREWENLAPILLGEEKGAKKVMPREPIAVTPQQPPAGDLIRFETNPILEPIKEHPWESKYVLNAGMIRLNNKVHMVYRAFGDDEISRLGIAISENGFDFTERLDKPIFEPNTPSEKMGCEDPRLTVIGDRVYMAYTAYDGLVAQIAIASISVKEFLKHRWGAWRRHGLVFPGFDDKDAAMFPETFNGKYAMLHRVDPHMWITFSRHLRCPWPRREHQILAGTTTGMMWDARKIGAGAQPIKTKYGWLLITHGVDYDHVYRLG